MNANDQALPPSPETNPVPPLASGDSARPIDPPSPPRVPGLPPGEPAAARSPSPQPSTLNQLTLSAQPLSATPPGPESTDPLQHKVHRRPRGKIASLPKAQRDRINQLLLDGSSYEVVAHQMAEAGAQLNLENIGNWYHSGFQEFLAALDRLEFQRARYEAASDLLKDVDTCRLPEADLQTAAAQIYDLLGQFTPESLSPAMAKDPNQYTRLLNALSRLARETLQFRKYREACLQAHGEIQKLRNLSDKPTEEETRAVVDKLDRILGFK